VDGAVVDGHGEGEIEEFLKRENVDVVVGCDLARGDLVRSSLPSFFSSSLCCLPPSFTAPNYVILDPTIILPRPISFGCFGLYSAHVIDA
jgi:hypothetical protein